MEAPTLIGIGIILLLFPFYSYVVAKCISFGWEAGKGAYYNVKSRAE